MSAAGSRAAVQRSLSHSGCARMYSGASPVARHHHHPVRVPAQVVHRPGQRAERREHLVRHRPRRDVAADHDRVRRVRAQLREHRLERGRVAVDVAEDGDRVGHGGHRTRSLDTDHRLFMIGLRGSTERGERDGHEPGRRGAGHELRVRRLPDRVAGGREGALLDPRRPALPEPRVAAVLRHRRVVADVRPHVPPVRHAVRLGLDRQERQRLRLHGGRPRRPVDPRGGDGVRGGLHAARPARPGLRREDRRLPRLGAARLRGELPGLVARPPAPRARAQLRAPRHLRHGAARACSTSRSCSRTPSTSTIARGRSTGCSTSRSSPRRPRSTPRSRRCAARPTRRSWAACSPRSRTATGTPSRTSGR